jgi:hypothetical protein
MMFRAMTSKEKMRYDMHKTIRERMQDSICYEVAFCAASSRTHDPRRVQFIVIAYRRGVKEVQTATIVVYNHEYHAAEFGVGASKSNLPLQVCHCLIAINKNDNPVSAQFLGFVLLIRSCPTALMTYIQAPPPFGAMMVWPSSAAC